MIYLIFPTETELGPLAGMIENPVRARLGLRNAVTGRLSGRDCAAIACGIGQANAAQSLTSAFERGLPELAILGGCAGAYPGSGLGIGDAAAAVEEIYAELGVETAEGFTPFDATGLPLVENGAVRYFTRFPFSGEYNATISEAAKAAGINTGFGAFLTVSTITGTAARAGLLEKNFNALCENMEGAAAAQVALLYAVPLIEIRGVSNMVEDRDKDKWDIAWAANSCALVIKEFLKIWKK